MENNDVPVVEAQDLREKASLIGVHCGLEIIVENHDVPFVNVRGDLWGGFNGKRCDVGVALFFWWNGHLGVVCAYGFFGFPIIWGNDRQQ